MPDPLRNLTKFAEDAVGDIRLIVHDYRAARASTGRISVGRFGSADQGFGDRATQFAVANIVAVVEHYAEQILLDAGSDPKTVRTWPSKVKVWQAVFGPDIEDPSICPSFVPMRGYYEVHNAIMHRRGELTDSQRRDEIYARLEAASVELVGFNVVVSRNTVSTCADVCVRCVEELDATV